MPLGVEVALFVNDPATFATEKTITVAEERYRQHSMSRGSGSLSGR